MSNLDATIVVNSGDLVTQDNVEVFIVEKIPFGDEAVFTTNPKDPEHVMPDQDDAPTPYQSDK